MLLYQVREGRGKEREGGKEKAEGRKESVGEGRVREEGGTMFRERCTKFEMAALLITCLSSTRCTFRVLSEERD